MPQTTMVEDMKTKISALKWVDTHLDSAITELERISETDQDAVEIMHMTHDLKRIHAKILNMRAKLQEVNCAEEKLQEGTEEAAEEGTEGTGIKTEEV